MRSRFSRPEILGRDTDDRDTSLMQCSRKGLPRWCAVPVRHGQSKTSEDWHHVEKGSAILGRPHLLLEVVKIRLLIRQHPDSEVSADDCTGIGVPLLADERIEGDIVLDPNRELWIPGLG